MMFQSYLAQQNDNKTLVPRVNDMENIEERGRVEARCLKHSPARTVTPKTHI